VLDFDGAICPVDVTEALLRTFADPSWWEIEREMRSGALGLRAALVRQADLLRGTPEEWLAFAVSSFGLDPTFEPFVRWARRAGLTLAIASDGLGFYIEPMLRAAGIEGIRVHTNRFAAAGGGRTVEFPEAHPVCVGCGTCKMNVVIGYRRSVGPTAFVGEGYSDRFGALYADATFAKHHLARLCQDDGIAFVPWITYDDVRSGIEAMAIGGGPAGAPDPPMCPGWTDPRSNDGSLVGWRGVRETGWPA
jgi:2-hydroxy-3-keto-5-methylthiopentenyl-1-phosphate phosphatase